MHHTVIWLYMYVIECKHLALSTMNFDGINIPRNLVPHNYLQLALAAQRGKQRQVKELLEKVVKE